VANLVGTAKAQDLVPVLIHFPYANETNWTFCEISV